MRFAIVNGQKAEAAPHSRGACTYCASEVIAKCGTLREWHWAHKGHPPCDPWWENETEWHRSWKNRFPSYWQEVVHFADDGEKHIADVKTDQGWVLEFQHSFLKPEERRAREAFYPRLAWIVDGRRRKRDLGQFQKALEAGVRVPVDLLILSVFSSDSALLKEWSGSRAPVFFDFGSPDGRLWCLLPGSPTEKPYVGPFLQGNLVEFHLGGTVGSQRFVELFHTLSQLVSLDLERLRQMSLGRSVHQIPLLRRPARSFRRF